MSSEVVSAKGKHELGLAPEIFLAVVSCLLALLLFYRAHLFSVPLRFTGDTEDLLIQAARLEHWFGVFRGRYHWRDPIFFYPEKDVLGYNDAYFLYGALYSVYRSFGLDQLLSMELTSAAFRAVGFSRHLAAVAPLLRDRALCGCARLVPDDVVERHVS